MVVVWVVYVGRILLLREGGRIVVMLVAGGRYAEECVGVEEVIFLVLQLDVWVGGW
jgi:hypothetical protein